MEDIHRFCCFDYNLFRNSENALSNNGIIVYAGIGFNFFGRQDILLTYNYLKAVIFGKDSDLNKRNIIKSGFDELVQCGYIEVLYQTNKEEFVCDVSKISKYDKGFTSLQYEEFQKIITLDSNVHSGNLIKYLLCCISTFDKNKNKTYNYKFGDKPQSYICSISGINIQSINRYNKILEDHHILYIARRKDNEYKSKHGGELYKSTTNIYCRYCDKEKCDQYLLENRFTTKKKDTFINISNEMRSLSQTYNYFQRTYKDKICEDMDKVNKAYTAAKQWNQYAKEDYERKIESGDHPEEPQYKDISIFDKYGLTD